MVPERRCRVKFIRRETTETRKANFITVCLSFLTFEGRFSKLTECGLVEAIAVLSCFAGSLYHELLLKQSSLPKGRVVDFVFVLLNTEFYFNFQNVIRLVSLTSLAFL